MVTEIHYWFTMVSPWAFLGHDAFVKLAKAHDVAILYKPVSLPEVFKETGGLPLADCCVTAIAEAGGDPSGFMQALWDACFLAEEDCGPEAKLAEFLSGTGHDAADILAAAKSGPIRAIYSGRPNEAISIGVFGSPCYVRNGEIFWGQDRLELLGRALASKRAPYTPDAV